MFRKWWFYLVLLIIGLAVVALFYMTQPVHAQGPPPQGPSLSPEVQQLVTQIHAAGCQAEEIASAQTIDQLRKENEQLKAQLQKLDPPKSGATKH